MSQKISDAPFIDDGESGRETHFMNIHDQHCGAPLCKFYDCVGVYLGTQHFSSPSITANASGELFFIDASRPFEYHKHRYLRDR